MICDDPPKYNVWDYPLHGKIDFQINAKSFALGWKKEFDIEEFTDSLSLKNLNRLNYTCKILYKIRVMCMQHNIKFTIVIPPLHRFLLQELGESPEAFQSFREVYIDKLIKPLSSDTQVNVLDYLNDSTYSECDSIWASSLFMNKIGAKLFTRQVLTDIGILR